MQKQMEKTPISANLAAAVTFVAVVVILMLIAVLNAPTQGGTRVLNSLGSYLQAVKVSAIPFLIAVGVLSVMIGGIAAYVVRREWPHEKRRNTLIAGYIFLAPYLLITLFFVVGVLLFALYISFTQFNIFQAPVWVGLKNYIHAFAGFSNSNEKLFIQSLYNVIWYALIVVPVQTALAIALAVVLNVPMRFKQFFRTIFYAPSVTSSVVITLIFIWLYLKTGYINFGFASVLGAFGVHWTALNWLNDPTGLIQLIVGIFGVHIPFSQWYFKGPSIAWMAIMVQNIFTTAPTFMIMFLAALQDIDPTLYEVASIDGASGWQKFWSITLPLLRPIILLVVVLGTIGTLQIFSQVYLATRGGPLDTTQVPVYLIYTKALGTTGPIQMGYASALAFILGVIIFIFTFIQRRYLGRE